MEPSFFKILLVLVEKICLVIVIAYLITRTKQFNNTIEKQPTFWDSLVLILVFGGFSIYGTYSGIRIFGAIANTRDLGPMIAGLVGGPFIGLGVGLIGGIHRYFLGGFTAIPCTLATITSGILGGLIYKFKKGEFIGVFWAILFAIFIESFHMFLALLIAKPFANALRLVKEVSLPMIGANAIGIGIFALFVVNLIKEKRTSSERNRYYAELERKIYEMEKLYHLGVRVSATLDINIVLDLCINTTVEVLEAKIGWLFLVNEKNNWLSLGSMAKFEDEAHSSNNSQLESSVKIIKREKKLGLEEEKSIAGWVVKNKKPLLTNDVDTKELLSNSIYKEAGFKVNSILCVPLLVKNKTIGVIQVCNKKDDTPFDSKDQHLLVSFAVHAAIAIENAKLYQEVAEKERMKKELEIAHKLQTSILPDKPPQIEGYQIAAMSQPAKEVGGDFYDFIDVAKDKIGLAIGDVAGKGLPAALFMALSRSFLRAQAIGNLKTDVVLTKTNKLITQDAREGMFVTALYAILDTREKVLRLSNAGHNPPILFHSTTGEYEVLKARSLVLGALEEVQFQEKEIILKTKDIIVFYTDGVIETMNKNKQQFGMEKLIKVLKDNPQLQATELIKLIQEKVEEFSEGQSQFDDFTLMLVRVT